MDRGRAVVHFWDRGRTPVSIPGGSAWPVASDAMAPTTETGVYLRSLAALVDNLRRTRGKTVISRIIAGHAPFEAFGRLADRLMGGNEPTFAFQFYHPGTGWWLGNTPEVLLEHDKGSGVFRTMALAGTRLQGCPGPWDAKNLDEHRFVVDFIAETFRRHGLEVEIGRTDTVPYGRHIEHLHTPVAGIAGDHLPDFETIAADLSPTPALCGYPRTEALEHIARFETHDRLCYGGYITVDTPEKTVAFVNLRSMRYDERGRYNIYVGGGITADSVPEDEYAETAAKARSLLEPLEEIIAELTNGHSHGS